MFARIPLPAFGLLAGAAVAAATLLTPVAAEPAAAADDVATVNGEGISAGEFGDALKQLGQSGTVGGDDGRRVLSQMIRNELMRQQLVADDVEAPDLDGTESTVFDEGEELAALLASDEDRAALADTYADERGLDGTICFLLIVTDDDDTADDIAAAFDDGAEFADVGEEFGGDLFAETDGALTRDVSEPCIDPAQLNEAADPIVEAVADAEIDEPVGPIDTELGTVFVVVPPFDDVSSQFNSLLTERAALDLAVDAEVSVDPRYGRWDAATATVVALDTAPVGVSSDGTAVGE